MAKILLHSDSPFIPTGFRNQTFLVAERLAEDGHEVFWLAPSHIGAPLKGATMGDGRKCNFVIMPGSGKQPHAVDVLGSTLAKVRPDIYYCLLDTFMLYNNEFLNMSLPVPSSLWWPFKSAMWFPSDGGHFPHQCDTVLRKFNHPVAMSKWARDQVQKEFNIKAHYIPHGIKTNNFYPLSDEQKKNLRVKYGMKFQRELLGKFVIGVVGRNQPRKHLDRALKAFKIFAEGKEDVVLMMHMDENDVSQPWPILALIERYKIKNKVQFTGMNALQGYPDELMYEIYNLCDVKLDTTSGEGFGVTIIESMACEVPVVITDYTTSKEIVFDNKAGLPINLTGEDEPLYDGKAEDVTNQVVGGYLVERGIADVKHAAQQLQACYDDWKKGGSWLKEMGKNGRDAVLKEYDFDRCVWPKWKELFEEMLK